MSKELRAWNTYLDDNWPSLGSPRWKPSLSVYLVNAAMDVRLELSIQIPDDEGKSKKYALHKDFDARLPMTDAERKIGLGWLVEQMALYHEKETGDKGAYAAAMERRSQILIGTLSFEIPDAKRGAAAAHNSKVYLPSGEILQGVHRVEFIYDVRGVAKAVVHLNAFGLHVATEP